MYEEVDPLMKQFFVKVAGNGQDGYVPVSSTPGVQARDVIERLGLQGYVLQRPDGGVFSPTDDLHGALSDDERVVAWPDDMRAG